MAPTAPKIDTIKIDVDKIKIVIGKGGETIDKIIAETGVKIDIDEKEGNVSIYSSDQDAINRAKKSLLVWFVKPKWMKFTMLRLFVSRNLVPLLASLIRQMPSCTFRKWLGLVPTNVRRFGSKSVMKSMLRLSRLMKRTYGCFYEGSSSSSSKPEHDEKGRKV